MEVKTKKKTLSTPLLIPSNQNQGTELSESKVADVVQLDVPLPVEGQFALLENHDSNILVKINTNELAQALDQQNEKEPEDKDSQKKKTANITVKLNGSSSSSSSEESTVPLMTQTPDDAIKTLGSVGDQSLSSESHLISLNDPQAEDQQTIPDASSTGELKKLPAVLTEPVNQLLTELNLTADMLQTAGVDLNSLEDLLNQGRYGSVIHFLTSTPLLLSLLRWPWVQRRGFDYSKSGSLKDRHSLVELAAANQFDLEAEPAINSPLQINAPERDMSDVAEGDNQFSVNESSALLTIHNSDRIFTTHALLLGSQSRLRGVFAINAFYEGFETTFEILWSLFVSSLLINGIYNFIKFPDERDNLLDILGVAALLNSFCIKSLNFLCYDTVRGDYEEALALSLSNGYLAACIFGVPLLFSMAHALYALPEATAWDDAQIKSVIQKLKDHQPSFCVDTMAWVFSTVISAAFAPLMPLAMLCELIPDPGIKSVLEKITKSIIWDARLNHKERLGLYNALLDFSRQSTQLTQIKALSLLAEIAAEISLNDLLHLQKTGADDDTVKTLIFMKTEAFKQLNYFAKHYQLPNTPHQTIRPLPRFLMANYFLWRLGYSENKPVQPLFYLYKGGKLFFWAMFYKTILLAILEKVNESIEEKHCDAEGKYYGWIDFRQKNDCTYCGNLSIYLRNVDDPSACIIDYLRFPRNLTDILDVLEQFKDEPEFSYNDLDLSAQKVLIEAGNLTKLLGAISHKFKLNSTDQRFFTLRNNILGTPDVESIISFFKNYTPEFIDFSMTTFRDDAFKLFANIFNTTKLYEVTFSELSSNDVAILGQSLNNSQIAHLSLYNSDLGVAGIKSIVKNLNENMGTGPILGIYNCTLSEAACIALAQELDSYSSPIDLSLIDTPVTSRCVKALASQLRSISLLSLNVGINEDAIIYIAQALEKYNLRRLKLTGYNVSENAIIQLVNGSSRAELSKFSYFDHRILNDLNYTTLIPKIVEAINKSNMGNFGWGSNPGYGWDDNVVEFFVKSIGQGLNNLSVLDLSNNQIGPKGLQALTDAGVLPNGGILYLGNNTVGSGIVHIGSHLNSNATMVYDFDFSNNNITTEDIVEFVRCIPMPPAFIYSLNLARNNISDKGAIELFKIIKKTSIKELDLSYAQISTQGAIDIANALVKYKPGLWIDWLNEVKAKAQHIEAATDLISLDLRGNALGDDGVRELCKKLPYTKIPLSQFYYDKDDILPEIVINCGVAKSTDSTSSASSLRDHYLSPFFLFRTVRLLREAIKAVFSSPLYQSDKFQRQDYSSDQTIVSLQSSITSDRKYSASKITLNILDLSHHQEHETIMINLHNQITVQNAIADSKEINGVIGSVTNHHVIIGADNTFMNLHKNRGTNLLVAGKNNILVLGSDSCNHIVIRPEQGIVKIIGFKHQDILHLIDHQLIYSDNRFICREINNLAVLDWEKTQVQLTHTTCTDAMQQVRLNNQMALEIAKTEVMMPQENHNSFFYLGLIGVCQTFLSSMSQSAWLTAIPIFAGEMLSLFGNYSREEIEKFNHEVQTLLLVSIASSPNAIAASLLARWLADRLNQSPQTITNIGIGTSMVVSVMENFLKSNASFGLTVLQSGVALVGSAMGSFGMQKLFTLWKSDKSDSATSYWGSRLSFWQQDPIDDTHFKENTLKNESFNRSV